MIKSNFIVQYDDLSGACDVVLLSRTEHASRYFPRPSFTINVFICSKIVLNNINE